MRNLGCYKSYPLEMNLVLEIRMDEQKDRDSLLLTVYFGRPNMFITLWFEFDYGTNPLLGTLII
jgi:hypothetical protein